VVRLITIDEMRTEIKKYCNTFDRCEGCVIKEQCDEYTNANPSEMNPVKLDIFYKQVFKYRNKVHDAEQSFDPVERPQHYASTSVECIDMMIETQGEEAVIDFCICNAFKYLWRHRGKNGDEDVRKANWYLNKAVELMDKYEKPNGF